MGSAARLQNKFPPYNALSEKSNGDEFQWSHLPLVGWGDENALLVLTKKSQQPVRQTQGQHSRVERPFYHRLTKPCKEFKFYHYDDPRAYIIQYRRDCSSLSTTSSFKGPLEMFMNTDKIEPKNAEEKDKLNGLRDECPPKVEYASVPVSWSPGDLLKTEVAGDLVMWKSGLERGQPTTRLAPINNGKLSVGPISNLTTSIPGTEPELLEVEKQISVGIAATSTKAMNNAAPSAIERNNAYSYLLNSGMQARRETLKKPIKTVSCCMSTQNAGQIEAKLSINMPKSTWLGSNFYWNQATSIRYSHNMNRGSSGTYQLKQAKPGKIVAPKKLIPATGLHSNAPHCIRQAQTSTTWKHQERQRSQGQTKQPSLSEAELLSENENAVTIKPQRIRDGTDPAFGKALYERLIKLEREQYKTSLQAENSTENDAISKNMEFGGQPSVTPGNMKGIEQTGDLGTGTKLQSVTDPQTPS